jgi:hypothetical protein
MRIESSVTSVSWIPSEGVPQLPIEIGSFHYGTPPPEALDGADLLHAARAFPGANELRAWIEVKDGQVVDCGQEGRTGTGATRFRLGFQEVVFPAVAFPPLRPPHLVTERAVRFVQTAGARLALPSPRRLRHKPFFQLTSAPIWTTLALTIHTDGRIRQELVEASAFPCHSIYDAAGRLMATSEPLDFKTWYRRSFGKRTPWGLYDSPALVREAEMALERRMVQDQARARFRTLAPGATLVEQGERGDELFLLLDGTLTAEVDGRALAELGPGSIVGERALLEGPPRADTRRTATLRAKTRCRVAVAAAHELRPPHVL